MRALLRCLLLLAVPALTSAVDMHLRLELLSGGANESMLDIAAAAPSLTWELPSGLARQTRAVITLDRVSGGGGAPVLTATVDGADQNTTLAIAGLLQEATAYTLTVRAETAGATTAAVVSAPLRFFTSLKTWQAEPIWAAPCAAGTRKGPPTGNTTTPDYAWFRSQLKLPASDAVVSALAFVSAEAPLAVESKENTEKFGLDRGSKILAAYKLHVDGVAIGVGPGRPRCGVVAQGSCDRQTPYDGFSLRVPPGATQLAIQIHAYGRNQPSINLTQRVIFQLVVRLQSGKTLTLASSAEWEAYDADCSSCSLFRPTGNSGGRFGDGFWYFYPHENMNASCLPDATSGWQQTARIQPPFLAPLRPKLVSPIALELTAVASLRKVSPGHFAFAMKSEVQGGVRLQLADKPAMFEGAQARVLLSEQLHTNGRIRFPMFTGATFVSNFSLGAPAGTVLEHHEYSNWRFGEIIFTDQSLQPLDVDPGDFTVSAWIVHYPFDSQRATTFASSSSQLDSVWALNQNSVKMLGLDMYSDSNARQRSDDCQADSLVASYAQVAATAELAMPRQQMQMVMDFTHTPGQFQPNPPGTGGYTVTRWADWTVIPALHVVNDALFTGDLRLANQYFDSLLEWHLYTHMINVSDTPGAGLVVDNKCVMPDTTGSCLSCLIDTSGGSDDNYQQSNVNAVVQAWVYYAMTQVAQMGRWIGKHDAARELDVKAAAMKKSFNRLMISDSGAVCDGICTEVNHTSIHASFCEYILPPCSICGGIPVPLSLIYRIVCLFSAI